jgi:predicted RNA-binding protein
MLIITLVFDKNANFFAENCQKSPKIVIITSTPGVNPTTLEFTYNYKTGVVGSFKASENLFLFTKRARLLVALKFFTALAL